MTPLSLHTARAFPAASSPTSSGSAISGIESSSAHSNGGSRFSGADRVEWSDQVRKSPSEIRADLAASTDDGTYGLGARTARGLAALRGWRSGASATSNASATSADAVRANQAPTGPETSATIDSEGDSKAQDDPSASRGRDGQPLEAADQRLVEDLKRADREVRQHEQAHVAVGGAHVTRGAQYEYRNGPDGQRYAVAGEVGIDVSSASSPEATIRKMQTVRAAALAPAEPSGQDRSVAAAASRREQEARVELRTSSNPASPEEEKQPSTPDVLSPETSNAFSPEPERRGRSEAVSMAISALGY